MLMLAKMYVESVTILGTDERPQEKLALRAVGKSSNYPADGTDEDNTYAKFAPQADLTIYITNPSLCGRFRPGQKFYVDFTEAL